MRDHYERMSDDLDASVRREEGLRRLLREILNGFSPVTGTSHMTRTAHTVTVTDWRRKAGLADQPTTGGGNG